MNAFLISCLPIISIHFLAVISPGPDFILITKNALIYPKKTGIYTALGISLGICIHLSYCIFGLDFLLIHALQFFHVLKYLGAAYLIYLGIQSWVTNVSLVNNHKTGMQETLMLSNAKAIWQGFLCNVLNPKVGLFFIGLFTVIIKRDTPIWEQLIYGILMVNVTFIWFTCVACFIARPNIHARIQAIQPIAMKTLGLLLVIMGLLLFLW